MWRSWVVTNDNKCHRHYSKPKIYLFYSSYYYSQVTVIWWLHCVITAASDLWRDTKRRNNEVSWLLRCDLIWTSTVKSTRCDGYVLLHSDESSNDFTNKSPNASHVTTTLGDSIVTSPWQFAMWQVAEWLHSEDTSQSNCNDFAV